MKSWQNKVPLFFGFDSYLTLFSVPAFGQLANLKINFSQKFLVEPISKLVPFFILPKNFNKMQKHFGCQACQPGVCNGGMWYLSIILYIESSFYVMFTLKFIFWIIDYYAQKEFYQKVKIIHIFGLLFSTMPWLSSGDIKISLIRNAPFQNYSQFSNYKDEKFWKQACQRLPQNEDYLCFSCRTLMMK